MKVKDIVKTIFLTEILKGLALTFKSMLPGHSVTRQYPEEPRLSMPGFRGLHALVREESGRERCIACGLCAAICPSQCITIHTAEDPEHVKVAERYEIEVLRCLFCGFCVEACPVGAIVLTEHYEYSDYSRDALLMDKSRLLENWDRFMAGGKGREYLERFWLPRATELEPSEGQAVFRPSAREAEK